MANKTTHKFLMPERGDMEVLSSYTHSASWPSKDVCFNVADFGYPVLHTHEYYEFLCILSGSISHTINGTKYQMFEGDCCFIRPTDCHCFELASDTNVSTIHVNFMLRSSYVERLANLYGPNLLSDILAFCSPLSFKLSAHELSDIQDTCFNIQTTTPDPTTEEEMICKGVINRLFAKYLQMHFSKEQVKPPAWLQSLILQLHNPSFFHSRLDEFLDNIPYSQSYVQHQFKKHTGSSIIAYRNSVKMVTAKRLLSSTRMSVQEIAFYLGFDSISHLNHLYKKHFGTPPLVTRKEQNEKEIVHEP